MKITHTQTEFACERHAARTAKRSRDPATSLHERALTGSVLADLAYNLAGADLEVCAPEHRQFPPTGPHPSSIRLGDARPHGSANFSARP